MGVPDTVEHPWSTKKKDWCCKVAGVCKDAFDCKKGNPKEWTSSKKKWCCKFKGVACKDKLYQCKVENSSADNESGNGTSGCGGAKNWTNDKKQWCCKNEGIGCE